MSSSSNHRRSHLFDSPETGSLDPDLISLVTSSPVDSPGNILDTSSLYGPSSTSLPSEIEDWIKLTDHELNQIIADGPPLPPSPPSELIDSFNLNSPIPNSLLNSPLLSVNSPGSSIEPDAIKRFSIGNAGEKFYRNPYVDGHIQRSISPSGYGYYNKRRPSPTYNSRYKPPQNIPYKPPNSPNSHKNSNNGRTPVYKDKQPNSRRRLDNNYPTYNKNFNTRFRNRNNGGGGGGQTNHGAGGGYFGMPNVPKYPKKKINSSTTYYPEGGRFNWNKVDTTTVSPKIATTTKVNFDDHRYDFGYGGGSGNKNKNNKNNGRGTGQTAYDEGRRRGKKNKKFKPSYSDNPINPDGQGFGFPISNTTTGTTQTPATTPRPTESTTLATTTIATTTPSSIATTTTNAPSTTRKPVNELKQALDEINELRSQLESEESKLDTMKVEARKFSLKLKQMIKRTRRRQLHFYDTLLEKTLRYNEDIHVDRIKSQLASIREAKALLDSKVTRSTPWKARYVVKRIRGQNLVTDSEKLLTETKKRINELDKVLRDLAKEKQL